ncbi:MAG: hypothetical protein K2X03_27855 [Bryobacteraceae bacterium]|nr:hypothetical protein [Bryobacteraceae bacterium]
MTKFLQTKALGISAALLVAGLGAVSAQQSGKNAQSGMSMGDMMKNCREHCQRTTGMIDQLTKQMDEARQSNDPAKMRSALEGAQKPLAEMKDHMSMCMNMMDMMQKMGGMPGMKSGDDTKTKK